MNASKKEKRNHSANKKQESIRLFQNPWLEKLSHVHPILPLLIWGPVAVTLIGLALVDARLSLFQFFGWAGLGLLAWSLTEYAMHRFVFHFAAEGRIGQRLVYLFHGIHHDDPNDATRLVFPPAASILLALILYPSFLAIVGPVAIQPFFGFYLVGYLCYDYIHYSIHHFQPKTRIGRFLKRHHLQHHFVTPNAKWGVSSPLWDLVFGTYSPKKESSEYVQNIKESHPAAKH